MLAKSIEEISYILGDNMLSMESKEKFLGTIRELNDDEKVVKASTWELNTRLRYESDLAYAKEQGIEKGIEDNKKEVQEKPLKK